MTTMAVPESSRKAAQRPRLLSSPVLGLAEPWAVLSTWKVVLAYSPLVVRTLIV